MCVAIDYTCPRCGILSGQATTLRCPQGQECSNHQDVRRPLRIACLKDWYCSTEGCEYNPEVEEKFDQTIRDFLEGNNSDLQSIENGWIRVKVEEANADSEMMVDDPAPLRPPTPPLPQPPPPPPQLPQQVPQLLPQAPVPATLVANGVAPVFFETAGRRRRAAGQPAIFAPRGPPQILPLANYRAPAAQGPPDLSRFSAEDSARIQGLLDIIIPRMAGTSGANWIDEEDELLLFLCNDRMNMRPRDLAEKGFLPHRTANGCDTRRSKLRKTE